jgi:hypothetical protein
VGKVVVAMEVHMEVEHLLVAGVGAEEVAMEVSNSLLYAIRRRGNLFI